MPIEAALLDIDGVVLDTFEAKFESCKKMFGNMKVPFTLNDFFIHWIDRRGGLEGFLKERNLDLQPEDLRELRTGIFRGFLHLTRPMIEAKNLLKALRGWRYRVGAISRNYQEEVRNLLEYHGLRRYFDAIIAREDTIKTKPHPDPYLEGALRFHLKPEQCVGLEDSEDGVLSVKAAGMYCIAVPNDFTRYQDFSRADKRIITLGEFNLTMVSSLP